VRRRARALAAGDREAGLTLIELLVATTMSVIVIAGTATMVISVVRQQPSISRRAQSISSARWELERMVRELRNGIAVDAASATESSVSFESYVRRTACGSGVVSEASDPSIACQVTYRCTASACSRTEAAPGVESGTETRIFDGIDSSSVFCYVPSEGPEPGICGPAGEKPPTYVRVTLHIPDPEGSGSLTVSDGATLRNATLTN
jgi:hypothetical protein